MPHRVDNLGDRIRRPTYTYAHYVITEFLNLVPCSNKD